MRFAKLPPTWRNVRLEMQFDTSVVRFLFCLFFIDVYVFIYVNVVFFLGCHLSFVIEKHVTFIHSLLEYLPVFTPCKWEQTVVSVTGAKEYGECVNIQPEFDLTVGLLIALVSSIISVIITAVLAPVFDVLNVKNIEDFDQYHDTKDNKKIAPAPKKASQRKGNRK